METNYFLELQKVKCEVEKKNWLNYISWSDWWAELKKIHPEATYRKVKNNDTYLFRSGTGWSVECEVTVWDITHCADLAVTDFKNQEIKYDMIKSTDIQNTLQRAFAKAIAMHWIGLYVYRGEDFPEEYEEEKTTAPKTPVAPAKPNTPTGKTATAWFNKPQLEQCIEQWFWYNFDSITMWAKDNWYTLSWPSRTMIDKYLSEWEL